MKYVITAPASAATVRTISLARSESRSSKSFKPEPFANIKTNGGKSAIPAVRTAIAVIAKSHAIDVSVTSRQLKSMFFVRPMTARQHMEQQKNRISVKGMVQCLMTTYDSRKKEQIIRTTALSSKNSRISRE